MNEKIHNNLNNIQTNYTAPFLWLHGEPTELIISEIDKIYKSSIRSICIESRTHEGFLQESWWEDMLAIFEECKRRNMQVWIFDDKHFPSGEANGVFKEKYKELRPRGITEYHMDVAGPVTDGAAMAGCYLSCEEDEIVSVVAAKHIPNSDKYSGLIDITDGLTEDMVYFSLPEGMWRIIFIVKTRSGYRENYSYHCDKLNPVAAEKYIEEVYEPHFQKLSKYFGNTFLGFFSDEPSFKNNSVKMKMHTASGEPFAHYPWGETLKARLSEHSDRWRELLAGMWFDIEGVTDKIRFVFMDIISDEYRKNYVNKLAQWCEKHDVKYVGHVIEDNHIHAETGFGAAHYFRALDGQHMAGIDVVLHQILPGLTECSSTGMTSERHMNNDFYHYYLAKLGSSLAHIDKKKKGRALCEIFGAYGWAEGTKIMKYLMDHMLVRGINYFVPHAFSPKPNDPDCPPNFYDSGENPQFRFFGSHMAYLGRMCDMLSGGVHIPVCALLYDAESRWINKEFLPLEKVAKELYDNLLDYDIIPADCIENIDENGNLNGEKYNVLLVAYSENMPLEITDKLKRAKIRVIMVAEDEVECPFEMVRLRDLTKYMKENGYYDVRSDYEGKLLRYYHYKTNDSHIYMFSNEDIHNSINATVRLGSFGGGDYTEYDVFENSAVLKHSESGEIDISLEPYNSRLIITGARDFAMPEHIPEETVSEQVIEPEFDISISEKNSGIFRHYKKTKKLFNITGAGNLPRFSGNIKYEAELEIKKSERCYIDLGYVGECAELFVNGKFAGERLFPPYRFDITDYLQEGKNSITINTVNHNGFAKRDEFSKYLLFEPSGLLGPVKLIKLKKI